MKVHIKRLTAMLLALCMALPAVSGLAAATDDTVFFYEDFNGYAENETETSVTAENTTPYVGDVAERNRGLLVKTGLAKGKISATWSDTSDNMVLAFDLKESVERSDVTVSMLNAAGAESAVLKITAAGAVETYDGKHLSNFGLDTMNRFAICADTVHEEYSVYINGRCVLSGWYFQTSGFKPSGIRFAFGSGETLAAEVYLDNIRAYSGTNVARTFTETEYNDEVIDIIDVPETMGTAVLTNNNFDDLPAGPLAPTAAGSYAVNELGINKKNNEVDVCAENGGMYLKISKISEDDTHADVNFTNDLNYLITQTDVRFEKFGATIHLSLLRDNVSNTSQADMSVGTIGEDGTFTMTNGVAPYKFKTGRWYNFAVAYSMPTRTLTVYVDYEPVAVDVPFFNSSFYTPRLTRLWVVGNDTSTVLDIDNFRVYEAREPTQDMGVIEDTWVSVMSDGTREQALLDGKTAMCTGNGIIYANGTKELSEMPEEADGEYYVSYETAKKLFPGLEAADTGEKIPVKQTAEALGLKVFEDTDRYLLIFSENEFKADEELLDDVCVYMKNYLPTAEELQADFNANGGDVHPRILATAEDFETIKRNIETDPEFASWHQKVIAKADTLLNKEIDTYQLSSDTGGQSNILAVARSFKEKMLYLGYAWKTTGDRKYFEYAWKELESCCSFPDWCPVHPLDTGEAMFAAAVGYDWFYDVLSDEQKKFIEENTLRLGIEPIRSAYYGKLHVENRFGALSGGNFVTANTNFNQVVNGGMVLAAMAFAGVYPEECFDAASKAIQSLTYVLPMYEPDGAWEEGPNYWTYSSEYIGYLISTLVTSCGSDYAILTHPGFDITPYYAMYLDSWQGINNFSDTEPGSFDSACFAFFGKYKNDPAISYQRYTAIKDRGCSPQVFDMLWYDADAVNEKPSLALDYHARGLDMVSIREDWDRSDSLNFGAHGGQNNVYHAHYDGGNWIFDLLGERWALDLGMDMATYVGNAMSTVYRGRAQGHNMLVFNPDTNEDFVWESNTPLVRFESAPKGAIAVYDNSEGYSKWCTGVTRGFYVGDDRRSLTVRDEFTVIESGTEVYWNMQTAANVEIQGNKAILEQNGKLLQIEFASDTEDFEIIATPAVPFEGTLDNTPSTTSDADKTRLMVKLTASGSTYIEAKLSAVGEPASESGMINKPIAEWTLPEGELVKRGDSSVSSIMVDGEPLDGFNPKVTSYTIGVLEGNPVPVVTAASDNGNVVIDQAESLDEVTTVTGYDSNGLYKTIYSIKYSELKYPEDLFGMTRNVVYKLTVSSTPEEQNFGANMLDGDLGTRWASQGAGENAVFDLGSVKDIDAIAIAYEWGDERNYSFDVEVSLDGEYYTEVFSGASCGTTEDYELIPLESRVQARYVRFIGQGNTVNTWNGVREFAILTQK